MMKHENALRTISEVSEIVGVETHVLRFWEDKFTSLKTTKINGRRYYSTRNIEQIIEIKTLLYENGLSIKDANNHLKQTFSPLVAIKKKLLSLKSKLLKRLKN